MYLYIEHDIMNVHTFCSMKISNFFVNVFSLKYSELRIIKWFAIFSMEVKIWTFLNRILTYRKDLVNILKPFMGVLNSHNINDDKYIPLLQSFSKNQLHLLHKLEVLSETKFNMIQSSSNSTSIKKEVDQDQELIKTIISGDRVDELSKLIQEKGIKKFNLITKSFNEVEQMKIPLIQYCIMENAIQCFKFLLVNGLDDPKKIMEEQNPLIYNFNPNQIILKNYEWDCMATAIFFGNKDIIGILEDRHFHKGQNPVHLEAAILSYRNEFIEEILKEVHDKHFLNGIVATLAKNNNIKGLEILISKGANINETVIIYQNIKILFSLVQSEINKGNQMKKRKDQFILLQRKIQSRSEKY